jgi:hypothetical protein
MGDAMQEIRIPHLASMSLAVILKMMDGDMAEEIIEHGDGTCTVAVSEFVVDELLHTAKECGLSFDDAILWSAAILSGQIH